MTEQELRALVRDAIARHSDTVAPSPPAPSHPPPPLRGFGEASRRTLAPSHFRTLAPSHMLFVLPSGADADGPCLIEPTVMCNHCGYCQSYGH